MSKTNRLTGRLVRSLKPWSPEDGPLIEVGTLAEFFDFMPSTAWMGRLADTTADGGRPCLTKGLEGRTFQGWRIGVLARSLEPWLAEQNPHRKDIGKLVEEVIALQEKKREASIRQSAAGVRQAAERKREAKGIKEKTTSRNKAPKVTSDALFRLW
jgi:hypothetical protein